MKEEKERGIEAERIETENKAKLKAEQYAKLNLEKVPQHYLQMTAHFAITGDKDAQEKLEEKILDIKSWKK